MTVINFAITKPLESKIKQIIQEQGFTSKAEFFRFAAINYINNFMGKDISQVEYENSVRELKNVIRKKIAHKKLPTLKEQLADLR